ncbi:MAG: DNA-binding transcriptional regulator [Planctomycetota bacterium]|jgi:LacI family transcriptional regulator|nr:DNA-binding transcriptional regulator [Planctomycetota bacterium]MDA1041467.1 DNA-binding transcriptional regulator [Planctomycetota bacterium]
MPASRRAAPRPSPRVALLIEASNAYGRGLLAGIHRHLQEQEPWTIFLPEHGRGMPPLEMLKGWRGEGVIARVETPAIAAAIKKIQRGGPLAVVDVSAARLLPGVPYVETDDVAIARLAAEHFIERDFRHLAFLGDDRFRWSGNRRDAFAAAARGRSISVYEPRGRARDEAAEDAAIEAWLVTLPKPVGLFACYDVRGRQAVEACRRAGLAVPDEVAVLGVDDDAVLCGLTSPPLSSVIPDAISAGRLAAELLGALFRGERLDHDEWLLPPLGIATRQSTDVLAIDDELVATAVRQIRERACTGIKVADLVRSLGVSRRVLERRFLRRLGHTPHDEIARVRFRRVEQLLAGTDLPLTTIAARAGFRHPETMTVAFTRRHGLPPSRWRQARS